VVQLIARKQKATQRAEIKCRKSNILPEKADKRKVRRKRGKEKQTDIEGSTLEGLVCISSIGLRMRGPVLVPGLAGQ
tara:strand:- start:12 stop:242 length:231 start_codon:yes stop_codon:yes gene_type:complete